MQREIRKILPHLELLLWCCFLHETDGGKRRKEAGTGGEKKRISLENGLGEPGEGWWVFIQHTLPGLQHFM